MNAPDHIVDQFIQILTGHGFHIESQEYSPQSFGNLFIDLCSVDVCCRLTRDRGQWFIDVRGSSSNEWFYLGFVRTLVTGEQFDTDWAIEDQIRFLDIHMYEIESLFNLQSIKAIEEKLRDRDRQYRQRMSTISD